MVETVTEIGDREMVKGEIEDYYTECSSILISVCADAARAVAAVSRATVQLKEIELRARVPNAPEALKLGAIEMAARVKALQEAAVQTVSTAEGARQAAVVAAQKAIQIKNQVEESDLQSEMTKEERLARAQSSDANLVMRMH